MIRFIVQTDDANMAANVGGSVHTSYRTFDVDLPELEKHLKTGGVYIERRLVGCELLSAADQPAAAPRDPDAELREFAGFLTAYLPELHAFEVPRMLDAIAAFRAADNSPVTPEESPEK